MRASPEACGNSSSLPQNCLSPIPPEERTLHVWEGQQGSRLAISGSVLADCPRRRGCGHSLNNVLGKVAGGGVQGW